MMNDHTAKAFDVDLHEITRLVSQMGGLAEKQIADSIETLARRDVKEAIRVVSADKEIDKLQTAIEEKCVLTIARRQPLAIDLRQIVGALRIANDMERIGDLAKNISKRVDSLDSNFEPPSIMRGIERMATMVLEQLKQVLDSFAARDVEKAMVVWRSDAEIDAMCTSLFRELLTYMMEDPSHITFCLHLMFCAKNIERMGDHATNIAETVYYMVEGHPLADERPKSNTLTALSASQ